MENVEKLKQMMQTSKMAFDYNYTMMMAVYEQNKMLLTMLLNQSTDIPDESKVAIEKWLQTYRHGCEDLKKMTDEGYKLVEKGMSSV
jgi:predicted outer membrane protein